MSLFRLLEISIYQLVDLFPNLILAIVPFRDSMRFSKRNTTIIVLVLYALLVCSRILALKGLSVAAFMTTLWIILYLCFYMVCIRAKLTKLLFVLLTVLNYGSFVAIIYSHFAFQRFPIAIARPYSFFSTGILLLTYSVSYPILYRMVNRKLKVLITFPENNKFWQYLWLVPATFCLSYYYNLYANGGIIPFSTKFNNVLFAAFFNLGALFVTYLVMHLLEESNANLKLKAENYQLSMQSVQYENLKGRIEDTRRAKHDLRQILAVVQSYLKDDDKDGLSEYMRRYEISLPSASPISYCGDYALNALIVYYADIAEAKNIPFDAKVQYPDNLDITDTDAAVLFGNLLENAIEACIRQTKGRRFISLRTKVIQGMLVITLDNSYSESIERLGDVFLSSKSKREGIGTSSIQKIATKYNGTTQFHFDDTSFHASVILNTHIHY